MASLRETLANDGKWFHRCGLSNKGYVTMVHFELMTRIIKCAMHNKYCENDDEMLDSVRDGCVECFEATLGAIKRLSLKRGRPGVGDLLYRLVVLDLKNIGMIQKGKRCAWDYIKESKRNPPASMKEVFKRFDESTYDCFESQAKQILDELWSYDGKKLAKESELAKHLAWLNKNRKTSTPRDDAKSPHGKKSSSSRKRKNTSLQPPSKSRRTNNKEESAGRTQRQSKIMTRSKTKKTKETSKNKRSKRTKSLLRKG